MTLTQNPLDFMTTRFHNLAHGLSIRENWASLAPLGEHTTQWIKFEFRSKTN